MSRFEKPYAWYSAYTYDDGAQIYGRFAFWDDELDAAFRRTAGGGALRAAHRAPGGALDVLERADGAKPTTRLTKRRAQGGEVVRGVQHSGHIFRGRWHQRSENFALLPPAAGAQRLDSGAHAAGVLVHAAVVQGVAGVVYEQRLRSGVQHGRHRRGLPPVGHRNETARI